MQRKLLYTGNSLRASSPGRSGGGAGKGRTSCNYVSRIWYSASNSLVAPHRMSCQISANQREAETSANVSKHWKPRAKGYDVITYTISANQHFASTFSMQIFKFQRRSCKLSFLFPPRTACSQATQERFCLLPRFENESLTQKRPIRILHILLAETLNNFSTIRPYLQYQGRFLSKPLATMMWFNNLLKRQQIKFALK